MKTEFEFTSHEKECAEIISKLVPVIMVRKENYITPEIFKSLVLSLAELLPENGNEIIVEVRGGIAYCNDPRVEIIDYDNRND